MLKKAGKDSRLLVYPSYGKDGHRLFFEVRPTYWKDVENFLRTSLGADSKQPDLSAVDDVWQVQSHRSGHKVCICLNRYDQQEMQVFIDATHTLIAERLRGDRSDGTANRKRRPNKAA